MKTNPAAAARFLLPAILLLASGCGDGDDTAPAGSADTEPERGGTAILVEGADISLPLSLVAQGVLDGILGADVMNMELVRGEWAEGELVFRTADQNPMALARGFEYLAPDSTALRFHLRSDVKWSDGTPLTAADVVFTYDLLADPEVASPQQNYTEHMDSVVAENDSTVTFHFARRYPEMLSHSAMAIAPKHLLGDVAPAQIRTHRALTDPAGNLVVSGPFMIGEWQRGQSITLVPNPHFSPQPYLDRIVIRIIPEMATKLVELQTGNVDLVSGITFDQIPNLQASAPHVRFEREQKRFYDYIAYNPAAFEAFADPEVRRALSLAVDVPGILRALQMDEYAVPAGGPYAPIFRRLYDPRLQAPVPHDPERARMLLDARGWRDADGDGIREKDGRPFRFVLVTNSGNQRRADVSQIVQQAWRQIGVDAQLRQLEFNTFNEGLIEQTYEAALGGWSVGLSADLTVLWGPGSPFNIVGYENPEVSRLFDQALQQPTEVAAAPFWRQAAGKVAQDQPYTFLYYLDQVDAVNNRLRDTRIDTYGIYQNTWEWWIPQARQRGARSAPTG